MPPKNQKNQKSKEEKRLEQYLNHPANLASSENQNKQSNNNNANAKKGGKNNQKPAQAEQQPAQNDTEMQILQLLKEVDVNKPLPDFSSLDKSISILRNTLEDMDSLVLNISTNNTEALGAPPKEEEESGFKTANLTPDIIKKRDQIIVDVKKTIEVYQQKQNRIDELAKKENMADIKEQLLILSSNLSEDIKSKEQILSIF